MLVNFLAWVVILVDRICWYSLFTFNEIETTPQSPALNVCEEQVPDWCLWWTIIHHLVLPEVLFLSQLFLFPPFCVFLCSVWEWVCRHVPLHVHTEARARLGMLSSVVACIEIASYKSGSSPFCLAGDLLGSTFLHSTLPKLQTYTPMPNFSYGYWGFELKSSRL